MSGPNDRSLKKRIADILEADSLEIQP